ncbi:MAG: TonB-dependent receptor plug domain-containing protein, partial [Ginsengibacter sp.]
MMAIILAAFIFPFSGFASPWPGSKKPISANSEHGCYITQSIKISGKVTDETGQPLEGVSINEKAAGNGTMTDAQGNFELNVASEKSLLEISFIGFTTRKVAVGKLTTFHIVLQKNVNALDSVVVIGYGTQKRGDLTGSVSSIKSSDIASLPLPDAGQAIQGKAAGVQIVSPGAPGSNVTIRVRGIGTVNSSDPLLVIDGVPTDIPLNTISPDDIASIDILKDASASAIYGSRGANGVVIV